MRMLKSRRHTLPSLPSVALEVWHMSRAEDCDFREVACLLERDTVLAGRVLGIAQSARYATRVPPTSVHEALVRLGRETVANILLEAAVTMKVFDAPGYQEKVDEYRLHSLAVAQIAVEVARHAGVDPGTAFLSGLLHDVGFVALLMVAGDEARARKRKLLPFETIVQAADYVHAEAGAFLTGFWNLPPEVTEAVRLHEEVDSRGDKLLATLSVADWLARDIAGCGEPDLEPVAGAHALSDLGLTAAAEKRIMLDASNLGKFLRADSFAA